MVMPVMMTNTTTVEDQIPNLAKIVEELAVHVQSQHARIAKLMAMVEYMDENNPNMFKKKSKCKMKATHHQGRSRKNIQSCIQ